MLPRTRLLALLNAAIPAIFIEGGAGRHKHALLTTWVEQGGEQVRVLVDFDHRQFEAQVMVERLAYQLELAGVGPVPVAEDATWECLAHQLRDAVHRIDRPLALGVPRMDELPAPAAAALIKVAGELASLRLVATAVDAEELTAQAVRAGVAHRVVDDDDLNYTADEIRELLASELPEAGEIAVRALSEATSGIPVLVDRSIALFGPECVAGTISDEQAWSGWRPERYGAQALRAQLRELVQTPRFSSDLLVDRFGDERAEYLLARMVRLGLGHVGQPLSGRRVFTWRPAVRRHFLQVWHAENLTELTHDRARLAASAVRVDDPELGLAMLLANRSLDAADALAEQWLWELTDADAALVAPALAALGEGELSEHPNVVVAAALVQRTRSDRVGGPEWLPAYRLVLHTPIAGDLCDQLARLARVCALAMSTVELGIATRAAVRWSVLVGDNRAEWLAGMSPAMVSDALLVLRALIQLDRIDLVAQIARPLADALHSQPDRAGSEAESRLSTLLTVLRFAAVMQGTTRAEVRALTVSPRQYHREFDVALYAGIDACEALDRGDLASAEAFTRVALFRLQRPTSWPLLILLRVAALIGLAEWDKLDDLADQFLATPRWLSWQHHPEACGFFASLAEVMLGVATGRSAYAPQDVAARLRALPPGALHRWPVWGRWLLDIWPHTSIFRGPTVLTDAELAPLSPRVRWQIGLAAAVANLRAEEEATALSMVLRSGARLRYPCMPLPLVLATTDEIAVLTERLPSKASPVVRTSVAVSSSFSGLHADRRDPVRFAAREIEVLEGVRRGLTNTAIAKELFVSVNTVKFHRSNLYRKLNASSREELLVEALRQGL